MPRHDDPFTRHVHARDRRARRDALAFVVASIVAALAQDVLLHDVTAIVPLPETAQASRIGIALGLAAIGALALSAALVVRFGDAREPRGWRAAAHLGLLNGALGPVLAFVAARAYGPVMGLLTLLAVALAVLAKGGGRNLLRA